MVFAVSMQSPYIAVGERAEYTLYVWYKKRTSVEADLPLKWKLNQAKPFLLVVQLKS